MKENNHLSNNKILNDHTHVKMEFRIEIVGVAVFLLAAAAGYYYYYYVRRRNDMDMIQANAGAVSRASQASAAASVRGSQVSQANANANAIFAPPAGSQLAVAEENAEVEAAEPTEATVSGQEATDQEATLQDATVDSNPPLQSSPVGSAAPKPMDEQSIQETNAKSVQESTLGSGRERLGSLQMHYEGSQSSPASGSLGTTLDIDEEGTLFLDCCTIVAACFIAAIAFAVGLCYLYGFTFQQLRQHPRFVHGVFIGSIVSLMVIFGYMYRLGHIPLFAPDESTAGSV